jgi:amidophosphoribosyltransferase
MGELYGEKCAVSAVVNNNGSASEFVAESLFALQHRGPEASGIASMLPSGWLEVCRGTGLVRDVFDPEDIARLEGNMAIGHNRYSTNGNKDSHLQPVVDESIAFSFAHNGNLPVTDNLNSYLKEHNIITQRLNDSEMMARTLAQRIRNGNDLPTAVEQSYEQFNGAFSCVAMHDNTIVAFKDRHGIRPLALGEFIDDEGFAVVSETCGLDIIDADFSREINPGEMVVITSDGNIYSKQLAESNPKLDLFELVYFARHDSMLYGERVNEIRRRFGNQLAKSHPPITDDTDNILVVPIPDTSIPAAEGYAEALGLKHRSAIIKSRYIGRTFLQPSQQQRHDQLKRKHSVLSEPLEGCDVILIDDSIVRGNTMPRLVKQVKASGAKTVSVLIASPPVRYPDFYGIDTPAQSELMAYNLTIKEMEKEIKANHLGFLSLSQMIEACNRPYTDFNLSCFNGNYPIDIGCHKSEIEKPVSLEYIDIF